MARQRVELSCKKQFHPSEIAVVHAIVALCDGAFCWGPIPLPASATITANSAFPLRQAQASLFPWVASPESLRCFVDGRSGHCDFSHFPMGHWWRGHSWLHGRP